jgi:hypothetical protein
MTLLQLVVMSLVGLSGSLAPVNASASEYRDSTYGFSLAPPAFERASESQQNVQVALFAGPAIDGFGPNCNVQIQNADLTLEQYEDLTNQQFKSAGWIVHQRVDQMVSGKPALRWHYSGSLRGKDFEWVAVVVAAQKRFYLLTCTALKEQFATSAAVFEKSIDSFRVE